MKVRIVLISVHGGKPTEFAAEPLFEGSRYFADLINNRTKQPFEVSIGVDAEAAFYFIVKLSMKTIYNVHALSLEGQLKLLCCCKDFQVTEEIYTAFAKEVTLPGMFSELPEKLRYLWKENFLPLRFMKMIVRCVPDALERLKYIFAWVNPPSEVISSELREASNFEDMKVLLVETLSNLQDRLEDVSEVEEAFPRSAEAVQFRSLKKTAEGTLTSIHENEA